MPEQVEDIRLRLDIDGKQARQAVRELNAEMKRVTKSAVDLNQTTDDSMQEMADSAHKFGVEYSKSLNLSAGRMTVLNAHIKQLPILIKKTNQEAVNLKKKMVELAGAGAGMAAGDKKANADTIKGLEVVQKNLEKQLQTLSDIEKHQTSANFEKVFEDVADKFGTNLRDRVEENFKGFIATDGKATADSLKDSFAEAASSLSSKNFGGLAKGLGGMLGSAAKGVAAKMTRGGMAAGGGGGMMAGMIGTLTKLGPILGMVSGAVMAIVKLFIDAEAAAKEFQKELLSTASTAEFLAAEGGNSVAAFEDMKKSVTSIRDAAFDMNNNLDMGITSKTHTEFLNVLTQEGVSLKRITNDAAAANKEAGAFTTEMVNLGVAYSRSFGVSLNDISALQGELMTEMGASFKGVSMSFASMQLGAAESGIAANKFFGIIRGISSELSLYNMRMEESVKILTLMGRAMSPRSASKFLQTMSQGFKGMDLQSRLRMTLLAGKGNTKDIVQRDITRKSEGIAGDVGKANGTMDPKKLAAAIASGNGNMKEMLSGVAKEQQGPLREAINEVKMQSKSSNKGLAGLASATGNLGAAGAYEMSKKALGRFSDKKTLMDMKGDLAPELMAQQLNISEEQLRQMIHFEGALEDQKDTLREQLKNDPAATLDKLSKITGHAVKAENAAATIDHLQADQVMDTMDEGDKKLLEESAKIVDWAKEQAKLTTSLIDKLDVIMQFLLNQFYSALSGIYDTIVDSFFGTEKEKQKRDALKGAGKDTRLAGAVGQEGFLGNNIAMALQGPMHDAFAANEAELKKARAAVKSGKTPAEVEAAKARVHEIQGNKLKQTKELLGGLDYKDLNSAINMAFDGDAKGKEALFGGPGGTVGSAFDSSTDSAGNTSLTDLGMGELFKKLDKMGRLGDVLDKSVLTKVGDPAALMGLKDNALYKQGVGIKTPANEATSSVVGPAVSTVGPAPASKDAPPTTEQAATTNDHLKDVVQGQQQMKLDPSHVKGPVKDAIEDGTLGALRQALFEYWMYSKLDPNAAATMGLGAKDMVNVVNTAVANQTAPTLVPRAKANAAGGEVLRPAAGEVLASVAPGETIIPKGGGGSGSININVNGIGGQDLANFLREKINQGIYEYKRREKFN